MQQGNEGKTPSSCPTPSFVEAEHVPDAGRHIPGYTVPAQSMSAHRKTGHQRARHKSQV